MVEEDLFGLMDVLTTASTSRIRKRAMESIFGKMVQNTKGLQHGNGILYSKSGNIKSQGKWSEGKFIKYKNLYKKTEELSVASEIRLSPNRRGK